VPAEVGKVSVQVPASAAVLSVTVPEDEPFKPIDEALGVISVGLVASTLLPLPVFVTLTMFLLESSASAVLAVRAERLVVPFTVRFVLQVVLPAK
jgi:hypothetical protein